MVLLDQCRGTGAVRPASILVVGLLLTCLGVVPAAAYWSVPTPGTGRRVLSEPAPAATGVRTEMAGALRPGVDTQVIIRSSVPGTHFTSAPEVRINPLPGRECPAGAVRVVFRGGDTYLRVATDAPAGCQGATVDVRLTSRSRS